MLLHVIQLDKPLVSYKLINIIYLTYICDYFFIFLNFFRLFPWLCLLHSIGKLWSFDSERFFELLGCDIPYCYELSSYFQARKRPTIHTWHSECKSEKVIYECYRDSKLIKWCFFYFSESCAWWNRRRRRTRSWNCRHLCCFIQDYFSSPNAYDNCIFTNFKNWFFSSWFSNRYN